MATAEQAGRLGQSIGVPVVHVEWPLGDPKTPEGTAVISIPGMTPEQADAFIDKVLVPERNALGIGKDSMGFRLGTSEDRPGFARQKFGDGVGNNQILVTPLTDGALARLAATGDHLRKAARDFLQANGLGKGGPAVAPPARPDSRNAGPLKAGAGSAAPPPNHAGTANHAGTDRKPNTDSRDSWKRSVPAPH